MGTFHNRRQPDSGRNIMTGIASLILFGYSHNINVGGAGGIFGTLS